MTSSGSTHLNRMLPSSFFSSTNVPRETIWRCNRYLWFTAKKTGWCENIWSIWTVGMRHFTCKSIHSIFQTFLFGIKFSRLNASQIFPIRRSRPAADRSRKVLQIRPARKRKGHFTSRSRFTSHFCPNKKLASLAPLINFNDKTSGHAVCFTPSRETTIANPA